MKLLVGREPVVQDKLYIVCLAVVLKSCRKLPHSCSVCRLDILQLSLFQSWVTVGARGLQKGSILQNENYSCRNIRGYDKKEQEISTNDDVM